MPEVLKCLLNRSPDPTFLIEGHRFISCNDAAVRFLGYRSRAEIIGRNPADLSPELQPDGEFSILKERRTTAEAKTYGIKRFEWSHRRADGATVPTEVTLTQLMVNGREIVLCVWRDLSDIKQYREDLRRLAYFDVVNRPGNCGGSIT